MPFNLHLFIDSRNEIIISTAPVHKTPISDPLAAAQHGLGPRARPHRHATPTPMQMSRVHPASAPSRGRARGAEATPTLSPHPYIPPQNLLLQNDGILQIAQQHHRSPPLCALILSFKLEGKLTTVFKRIFTNYSLRSAKAFQSPPPSIHFRARGAAVRYPGKPLRCPSAPALPPAAPRPRRLPGRAGRRWQRREKRGGSVAPASPRRYREGSAGAQRSARAVMEGAVRTELQWG